MTFTEMIGNDKLLRFDSELGEHCVIIFSFPAQFEILAETVQILTDGSTFNHITMNEEAADFSCNSTIK
jgi:hypothetical protein